MPGWIREHIVKALTRSSGWGKVRRAFIKEHPLCAVCGHAGEQVHHKRPFHLQPSLELDPQNLITLCTGHHHLLFGHLDDWKAFNPSVVEDSAAMLKAISARPYAETK